MGLLDRFLKRDLRNDDSGEAGYYLPLLLTIITDVALAADTIINGADTANAIGFAICNLVALPLSLGLALEGPTLNSLLQEASDEQNEKYRTQFVYSGGENESSR